MEISVNMFIVVTVVVIISQICGAIESPEPEVFLQPRNYNPHPYAEGGRVPPAIAALRRPAASDEPGRRGPVLFPPNPGDGVEGSTAGYGNNGGVEDRGHPYAGVARKQKIKLGGRFAASEQENNINPRVYSALANYAEKVLKKPVPFAVLVHRNNGQPLTENDPSQDSSLSNFKKNYVFSYTVRDKSTGDDFSHSQSQNSRATNGEYRVKLPDGRVQIVSYTADRHGYKADVKYAVDDEHVVSHQQRVQLTKPSPRRVFVHDFDYYERPQVTQVEVPIYHTGEELYRQQGPKYHEQQQAEYVTIYPKLDEYKPIALHTKLSVIPYVLADKLRILSSDARHKVLRIPQNNIQVTSKAQHGHNQDQEYNTYTDNSIQNYNENLVSTVAPPIYVSSIAPTQYVSTVAPPGYSQVYITTPKYTVDHEDSHPGKHLSAFYKKR